MQKPQKAVEIIKNIMKEHGVSVYKLSKMLDMRYEILRRVFVNKRILSADEFLRILDVLEINFSVNGSR